MSKSSSGIFGVSGSSGSRGADGDDGGKDSPGPGGGSVLEEAPLPSFDSTSDEELSPELPSSICPPASEDDVPLGPGGAQAPASGLLCAAISTIKRILERCPPRWNLRESHHEAAQEKHNKKAEGEHLCPPADRVHAARRAPDAVALAMERARCRGEDAVIADDTISRLAGLPVSEEYMPRPNAAKKSTNDPKMTGRCTTPMLMIPASCSTATTMNAATTMLIHVQMGNIPRSRSITFATCAWA
eukprot:CAMPEP_0185155458 /NCGR_PEP_ID=MMETSP1139-20130426/466_1 /TAXON_ID=298111 /ORGANISM="Pavlova sp., Strain CCMP459" /LENGTH=243 /DNA_ID=CAMNT_0027720367 /DNA_START=782 /DNA_END=1513 /DNA_ORIENTATION=-